MRLQFNRGYDVDNRHKTVKKAIDNETGKAFLKRYIGSLRDSEFPRVQLD